MPRYFLVARNGQEDPLVARLHSAGASRVQEPGELLHVHRRADELREERRSRLPPPRAP